MKVLCSLSVVALVLISACGTYTPVDTQTQKTQLQIREYQTRTYDVQDPVMVLKAVANVLQDEGYMIKDAEVDLGIISAGKEVDIESGGEKFLAIFFWGVHGRWKKNMIIESTANVSDFGEQVKVRVNFQAKALNNKGEVMEVRQIEDEQFYQDFFSKVDKGIFIQQEQL